METIEGGFRTNTAAGKPTINSAAGERIKFQQSHTIPTDVVNRPESSVFRDLHGMRHADGVNKGQRLYDHRNFQLNGRYLEDSRVAPAQSTFGTSTHANGLNHERWRNYLASNKGFGDLNERWEDLKDLHPAGSAA